MSGPLLLGCLWVVAAAGVSFLPMRAQFAPGLALLIAAPVLIAFKLRPDSKDAEDEKDEKPGNAIGGKPAV